MRVTQDIGLALKRPPSNEASPLSEILYRGQPTGTTVEGAVLEAAVETDQGWLLFLTDDVPFEEGLNIHLLDRKFALLDSAALVWMYATGSFKDLRLVSATELKFRFFDNGDWTLTLLPETGFRMPLVSEPRGVSRRFGFTRRFVISEQPAS